ncbi:hypothetical protein CC1G_14843 [Coprinopsis cinerea okayama7|uniref:Uncharacterized protein n=1 Tax=Coprinopsis cinerea (strain Okayama-7 / 130 / ATCC MYA-4618 / FGSC 9003) TaxID=240176 RepID=D6RNQ4_COPC7|nr:hypothetical protein CC1G_14843 [Coprinopsis cinerea okayama7\|eukprot:XP_002910866.1 hypothetical protein CC1G_14843 [Coprinopsis cinerea okayama7\
MFGHESCELAGNSAPGNMVIYGNEDLGAYRLATDERTGRVHTKKHLKPKASHIIPTTESRTGYMSAMTGCVTNDSRFHGLVDRDLDNCDWPPSPDGCGGQKPVSRQYSQMSRQCPLSLLLHVGDL